MFTELGPLVVGMDGNVTFNPFSWNKLANVFFLEQPAGVGFSYPNLPANDSTTADDTYHALLAFFAMHPELQGRPFYVMGESYGGHYVPNTVAAIEAGNAKLPPGAKQRINLIGFAVGNGYTDWQLDFNANVPNTRYHALTSQSRLDAAQEACSGDYARCFWPRKDVECPAKCDSAVRAAVEDAMDGSIDIYDIYEDVCLDKSHERLPTQGFMLMQERRAAQLATVVQVEERSEPSGGGDGGSSSLSSGGGGGGGGGSSPLATAVGGRGDGSFGRDKTTSRAEEDHVAATAAVSSPQPVRSRAVTAQPPLTLWPTRPFRRPALVAAACRRPSRQYSPRVSISPRVITSTPPTSRPPSMFVRGPLQRGSGPIAVTSSTSSTTRPSFPTMSGGRPKAPTRSSSTMATATTSSPIWVTTRGSIRGSG